MVLRIGGAYSQEWRVGQLMASVGNDGIGGAVGWPRWTGDAVGLNFMQCIDVLHGCLSQPMLLSLTTQSV